VVWWVATACYFQIAPPCTWFSAASFQFAQVQELEKCLTSLSFLFLTLTLHTSRVYFTQNVWLFISGWEARKDHVVKSLDHEGMNDSFLISSYAANNIAQFMRRAAASKESQTPPAEPTSHKSKRPRLSTEAESPRASDMEAISAALAAEEEKRQQAIARAAAEAGETHWVLDVPPAPQATQQPLVLAADSLDADDEGYSGGRRAFGNFKRKERKVSTSLTWDW
jgi:hypothetical protein